MLLAQFGVIVDDSCVDSTGACGKGGKKDACSGFLPRVAGPAPITTGMWANALASPLETALDGGRALLAFWPWLLLGLALGSVVLLVVAGYRRYRRGQRETRFTALFEAAPGALLLLDEERRIIEANESACKLLGRPLKAVQGERMNAFLEAVGAETPQAAFEAVEEAVDPSAESEEASEPPPAQTDARLMRPKGAVRRVRLQLRALALGGRRCIAATLQDMTSVSEEHAIFRGFHRRTVQDLPIELAVLSPEGTYLYANPAVCTDEISPQWLEGKTDFDLCRRLGLHPEVALRRRSHRRRALQGTERVQFEEVLSRRDAAPRHVQRFYTPVRGDNAEVHAVVTYALDRTEQKRCQEALEKAQRASEEYEEKKTSLLRNLRHEFRTPLTTILSAAEVLEADAAPDLKDFVGIVHQSGQRLLRTLNAMLDLAGTQTARLDEQPRVLSVNEAIENVISELASSAEEKGLFLRKQALAVEAFVRADPASLYRVLRSIIGNAVKFTDEGGVVVEVDTSAGQVEVRVIDTGAGIDEAYLPKLFDSFGQQDGTMTRHYEGAGVGLAVAQRLLAVMGGTVEVDSENGEGSVFTVTLPLAFRGATGERPRVLVVEERPEQIKMLRHHLGEQVQLAFARTPADALDGARAGRFDAVLVSASPGPEDAAGDFVERFREVAGYEKTPIIVIDDNALPGAAEQFEADGYDGYVARPLQRKTLLNALGDALAEAGHRAPASSDSQARSRLQEHL